MSDRGLEGDPAGPDHRLAPFCLLRGADCAGRLLACEAIPHERIRAAREAASVRSWQGTTEPLLGLSLDQLHDDPRNLLTLCEIHWGRLRRGELAVGREALPEAVEEFAAAFGLGGSLERDFGPPDERRRRAA